MIRRLLALTLLLLPLAACSEVQEAAGRTADCAGLVSDVAQTGLSRTPTVEDAEAAVRRLDERLASVDDAELRAAVDTLRARIDELAQAARTADGAQVQAAAERARDAARGAASVCGVPVDQLLGG